MKRNVPGPVAVLAQAWPAPALDGIDGPGWASESGADIAFALRSASVPVVTSAAAPDPRNPLDWVFPDTNEGLMAALAAGAHVLWATTALTRDRLPNTTEARSIQVIGQDPAQAGRWNDRWSCNERLRERGLPVARSILVGREGTSGVLPLGDVKPGLLAALGLETPLMVKPVRGRGGDGVRRVDSVPRLVLEVIRLIEATVLVNGQSHPRFGSRVMVEEYLPGAELAITVMPPGRYDISGRTVHHNASWCLPPVSSNGTVLDATERRAPGIAALPEACAAAGDLAAIRAPIRIDCRQRADGAWQIFDLKITQSLTGPGRPGRGDQASPTTLAAGAIGWSYVDLLRQLLGLAW